MKSIDPSRMSTEAIMAELGELLAAGFERHIASSMCPSEGGADSQNHLDESVDSVAQCGGPRETST